jgi:hypothetical protein
MGFASLVSPNTFSATQTIAPSDAGTSSLDEAIITQQYVTGSTAGPTTLNLFKIWSDDISAANAGAGGDYFVDAFSFNRYFGGAAARGGRHGVISYQYLTAPTDIASTNRNYVALGGVMTALSDDGGTAPDFADSLGAIFGGGAVGVAANGAVNLRNVTAHEFNVAMQTGSSVYAKSIIQLSSRGDDRVKGSGVDAIIWIYNQNDASIPKWDYGILFEHPGFGAPDFPFDATSTVIATGAGTFGVGIDFTASTIATSAFASPGFSVNGAGSITGTGLTTAKAGDPAVIFGNLNDTTASRAVSLLFQFQSTTRAQITATRTSGSATETKLSFRTTPSVGSLTENLSIESTGSVVVGDGAVATDASDGFLYIPGGAGPPTGTPTAFSGRVPLYVDTTNNKLYFYSSGAWRDAGP